MARHRITIPLAADLKPELVFEASQATFKTLGWEVYKMRAIAYLVEGRITLDNDYILGNIITNVFGTPEISISIKSDTASQETVETLAAKLLETLESKIAAKK